MSVLGLNDIMYIVPEFSPKDYVTIYTDSDCDSIYYQQFFERYKHFEYD